jgi:hypothetical protein
MAIGVLKSKCHTYRHDLESFIYVFLWTIITNHTENSSETSRLRQWSNGDWDEQAVHKFLDMDQNSFQTIFGEFPPEFHSLKPLAGIIRQILFPLQGRVIWTGTDGSSEATDELYDRMIRAFEEAIVSESRRKCNRKRNIYLYILKYYSKHNIEDAPQHACHFRSHNSLTRNGQVSP